MTCGIYALFSSIDDACLYVGQSQNVEARYRQHVTKLKKKRKSALRDFVDWYHANDAVESLLRFELLESCVNTDIAKNKAEAYWFEELKPRFYGKVPSLSEKWSISEATKDKIAFACTDTSRAEYLESNLSLIVEMCTDPSLSREKIAQSLGVPKSALRTFMTNHSLRNTVGRKKIDLAHLDETIRYYAADSSLSFRELERLEGVPHQYLYLYCKENGIEVPRKKRSSSEVKIKRNVGKVTCSLCGLDFGTTVIANHQNSCLKNKRS